MQKNRKYSIRIPDDVDDFISSKMKSKKSENLIFLIRLGIEFTDVMDELRKIIKERK